MLFSGWKEKLFQRYLIWVCRPARIKRYLRSRLPERREIAPLNGHIVRAAALQLELKLFNNPIDYVDEMHRRLKEAVQKEAQLVAFPEYNNLFLLGMLPGIEQISAPDAEQEPGIEDISLAEIFRYMSPAVQPLIHTLFSAFASAYGLYIMAGSYTISDGEDVYNRSFLYGPDGKMVGSQNKVHLLPAEKEWGLKSGSSFSVYETELGRLAMPVCMDATYFETFRVLEDENADIVLLPIADNQSYNYWLALRGIWPRVQECPMYGVKSALVGNIAGFIFTGRAAIYAPLEITPALDGVLAEVKQHDQEELAVADLDLKALHELRRNHPWRDVNRALYSRYLPDSYDKFNN